ncbi:Sec-independent protein translocase subunit TatA [uncultured Jatrophihabitans sp.]|uniref:Sec-independent protein translocase subunit TatA n=1 Tax=uncultured Jatrophihabitans sp. TaxID=1610747 RepID=UPI0035C952EE
MELFSPGHLVVLAIVIAFLFFGWKQLPDMSRSLGRSLRVFKTEIKGMSQDDKERAEAETPKAIEPPPAQIIKNPNAAGPSRPRPTPRPTASSANGEARQTGQ